MSSDQAMVSFDHVSKRYRRGGRGGSLRDAIPQLTRRLAHGFRHARPSGPSSNQFWAVHDVSFEVQHGEALGIIGHNGAGKSTILKLLAGVTAPTIGRARVNGRFAALIELGAGFHPDLTGRENIYLNGSILGLKRAEIDRKLDSIIDFASLEKFIDTPVKRFSSGMQARLGFAVAANVEPDVLLIDEVLSVGDFPFQQKCLRKMEEFRRSGVAIVFVSHNLNAIGALCSKAILLQAGQIKEQGTPKDVIAAYTSASYDTISDEEASAVTDMEHGRVTRHIEIVGADIRDRFGRSSRSFSSGDEAEIIVEMRVHRDATDPIVGIGLRNGDGTMVYGTNSSMQQCSVGEVYAGDICVVAFSLRLNLCEGTYLIAASVSPSEGHVMMDWREGIVSFTVLSDQTGTGVAELEASMRVEKPAELAGHERATWS